MSVANVIDVMKQMINLSFKSEYLNEAKEVLETEHYKKIFSDIDNGLVVRGENVEAIKSAVGTITMTNMVSAIILGYMTQFGVMSMSDMLTRLTASMLVLLMSAFIISLLDSHPIVPNKLIVIISVVLIFEAVTQGIFFISNLIPVLALFTPISCINVIVYLVNAHCYVCVLGALISSPAKKHIERMRRGQIRRMERMEREKRNVRIDRE